MNVTIDFRSVPPPNGTDQMVFRITPEDKLLVDQAARSLYMSTAQFVRSACVMSARAIANENPEQAEPVDRRSASFDPDTPPGMK